MYFGLPAISDDEKNAWRELILGGGPWSETEKLGILDYCETDVKALALLYPKMQPHLDAKRAQLRGCYMQSVAKMENHGIPIDTRLFGKLLKAWPHIQDQIIQDIDADFGVYEGTAFKASKFAEYLSKNDIAWPLLAPSTATATANLALDEETFKQMAEIYPQIQPLRELRAALATMRNFKLPVGSDGRNRCLLSPFRSTTGRNQPSTTKFVFGLSSWMRGLIQPQPGWATAYIDWSQQEFGIAAALSGDQNMIDAYRSGDPYLTFGKQAGAVPADATKQSHKAEREQFKACVLAVQYGMTAYGLAPRINQPTARARQLLLLHRNTYKGFWRFSENILNQAALGGRLWAAYGWQIHTLANPDKQFNSRSVCNFPMQANGAEMLRIACILLTQAGIKVCAPVHDALLIEARIEDIDATVAKAQGLMRQASAHVLNGFELSSDAKIVQSPDRYMDERGTKMWNKIMALIDEPLYQPPAR